MANRLLVDGTDLAKWAVRRESQETLPELLRRLVHATVTRITNISFPAGEGVQLGGYDGNVTVETGNAFVPDGHSVWELSARADVKNKADDDYEKRADNPLEVIPKDTVYVFVTPRRWGSKNKWVAERRSENKWLDVRAYDADDLEQWLELAPAVHAWISTNIGKCPVGAQDISSYWTGWTHVTNPPITSSLILSGRKKEYERVYDSLHKDPCLLPILTDTVEEATAFICSVFYEMLDEDRVHYLARAIVVQDDNAWRQLIATQDNLVLIPMFDVQGLAKVAVTKGHHVLLPLGCDADASSASGVMVLPRLKREPAQEALVSSMGISKLRSRRLAVLARHSLSAFRRRISVVPIIRKPQWATPIEARNILPFMLAGIWDESNMSDRQVVQSFAGVSYARLSETLELWANEPDPPVRRVGNMWMIVSKQDAWELLAKYLTPDQMERFVDTVVSVFREIDPQFNMPPGSRLLAQIQGKILSNSGRLRTSLADTVALIAVHEAPFKQKPVTGQEYADRITNELLGVDSQGWKLWASMSNALECLAEAAPDQFLRAVENGVSGDEPVLSRLIYRAGSIPYGPTPYIHLLWALEILAWKQEYLCRVSVILASLTRLTQSSKSNIANSPASSFRKIHLPWYPQTTASVEQRLTVIDVAKNSEPLVSWQLMISLIPTINDTSLPISYPVWRDWMPDPLIGPDPSEIIEMTQGVMTRLLHDVGHDCLKWTELLNTVGRSHLPAEINHDIIDEFMKVNIDSLDKSGVTMLQNTIRNVVARYHALSGSLSTDVVDKLKQAYLRLQHNDVKLDNAWLFSVNVENEINIPMMRCQDRANAREDMRKDVVTAIYQQGGIHQLLRFTMHVGSARHLWFFIGKSGIIEPGEEDMVFTNSYSDDLSTKAVIQGFVSGRYQLGRWDWVDDKWNSLILTLPHKQQIQFLLALPSESHVWNYVDMVGNDAKIEYWSTVDPRSLGTDDGERVTTELLRCNRPIAAASFIVSQSRTDQCMVSAKVMVKILDCIAQGASEKIDISGMASYHITKLLDAVCSSDEINEDDKVRLEWTFFNVLECNKQQSVIHGRLARDPDFFLQILCMVYKNASEPPSEYSDIDMDRFTTAQSVLASWQIIPGANSDGSYDVNILRIWVQKSRQLATGVGRLDSCDLVIGRLFSHAKESADSVWPRPEICTIIEEIASKPLEDGMSCQEIANRGVTTKDVGEGGLQEVEQANRYRNYVSALGSRWPRTSTMVEKIACMYEKDAKHEDLRAELREDDVY